MPVWATGQLFWQSESALHMGMHVGPEPVVAPLVTATELPVPPLPLPPLPLPPLPPFPLLLPPLPLTVAPPPEPLLKSTESVPLAQAAINPPVARTRTRTLMLA